ncbi:response regulator [Ulvibacter antarcticus]|uniref:Response regulator receiver domain-containing protein n=1 Tax=Ulvibacter antarcticus TaxID=442714 RepID=A0A3L9Z1L1_9FLAO|nr:response regulator [Ulvibacter antarcticus]RMA66414.1 response regulator receiver domain-containing protein [Ulvibacter antarcticus]
MSKKLTILFLEDDIIEIMKMNRTINKLGLPHRLLEAKNGEEAIELLKSIEVLPDIILLDLNMPKMNGIEFLTILKTNEFLQHIPVIMLTTSNTHSDLKECYKIGIAGYMLKPLSYKEYVFKIETLLAYWSANELI